MIVKRLESPVYHRRERKALPGRGAEVVATRKETGFEQYLLEAFRGEVVQQNRHISPRVSKLTQENLIRLGDM